MAKKTKKKAKASRTAQPRYYRVLSLDGGGIRGILTAVWLAKLEEHLGDGRVADHFDLVAGTSTGAILACAVSMRIPAAEIVDMYREHGREIFPSAGARLWSRTTRLFTQGPSAPKYDDSGLEAVLKRVLGETRFGELEIRPTLVTAYDLMARKAVVFKNTHERHADFPVWEVAKASSSAPTFFPAHVTRLRGVTTPLVDGGVVANNPTACAIAEAMRVNSQPDSPGYGLGDVLVASFGTGESTRPIPADAAREWGAIEWAVPIISVLFDGAGDATEYIASQLLGDGLYYRLQTRLLHGYDDMDDASETNLDALVKTAQTHLDGGADDELADLATKLRRRK